MGGQIDLHRDCDEVDTEELARLEAQYDRLQRSTVAWLRDHPHSIPSRWYALLDETYAEAVRRGCQPTAANAGDIQLVLDNIPFVSLPPPEAALRDAFETYMQTHILVEGRDTETADDPTRIPTYQDPDSMRRRIEQANQNLSRMWGPRQARQKHFPVFEVRTGEPPTTLAEFKKQWLDSVEPFLFIFAENSHHRFLSPFLVRWTIGEDRPIRYTLLYLDTHRRIKGLFDPNPTEATTVVDHDMGGGRPLTRRDLMRQVLAGFRPDDRADAVEEEPLEQDMEDFFKEPDAISRPGTFTGWPWDAYVCLLTRALVQRFGCLDVMRTGWVVRRLLYERRDRYREPTMRRWVARIAEAEEAGGELAAVLGVTTTVRQPRCPAFRSDGGPCGAAPEDPTRSCYCAQHPFTGLPPVDETSVQRRLQEAFEAYMQAHILDGTPVPFPEPTPIVTYNHAEGFQGLVRIEKADQSLTRVWGPKVEGDDDDDSFLFLRGTMDSMMKIKPAWHQTVRIEERERLVASPPRSRHVYLLQWYRGIPETPHDPSVRYTLLCVDSQRRVQTLFDPNETETWSVDGKQMTRRDVVRKMLEPLGYRADERVEEEEDQSPGAECPWDAYLCLVTRALAQRFDTDVLRTGWVVRRILRTHPERFSESVLCRWVARLADLSGGDLSALKVALGVVAAPVDDGSTCPVLQPSGHPCGGVPHRDGYCSLHPFTLPSA